MKKLPKTPINIDLSDMLQECTGRVQKYLHEDLQPDNCKIYYPDAKKFFSVQLPAQVGKQLVCIALHTPKLPEEKDFKKFGNILNDLYKKGLITNSVLENPCIQIAKKMAMGIDIPESEPGCTIVANYGTIYNIDYLRTQSPYFEYILSDIPHVVIGTGPDGNADSESINPNNSNILGGPKAEA